MFELILLFRSDDWPISGPTRMENDRRETTTVTWEASKPKTTCLFLFIYPNLWTRMYIELKLNFKDLKPFRYPSKPQKSQNRLDSNFFPMKSKKIELATFDNFRRILIKRTSADMDSENPGSSVLPLSVRADGQRTENSDRNTDSAVGRRLVSGGLVDIWKFLTLSEKSLNQTKKCCSEIMTAILCLVLRSLTSP